jgi:hypothetical protein
VIGLAVTMQNPQERLAIFRQPDRDRCIRAALVPPLLWVARERMPLRFTDWVRGALNYAGPKELNRKAIQAIGREQGWVRQIVADYLQGWNPFTHGADKAPRALVEGWARINAAQITGTRGKVRASRLYSGLRKWGKNLIRNRLNAKSRELLAGHTKLPLVLTGELRDAMAGGMRVIARKSRAGKFTGRAVFQRPHGLREREARPLNTLTAGEEGEVGRRFAAALLDGIAAMERDQLPPAGDDQAVRLPKAFRSRVQTLLARARTRGLGGLT